uniref:Putative secreted peptide n=1 Tax=Anopheles braziliensis TaxID=58242 RepID=A0A2M3ZTW0_9DIPT
MAFRAFGRFSVITPLLPTSSVSTSGSCAAPEDIAHFDVVTDDHCGRPNLRAAIVRIIARWQPGKWGRYATTCCGCGVRSDARKYR